ncbi:MAG: diguanylate cyclase, partial [Sulfurimicrobium sp.]
GGVARLYGDAALERFRCARIAVVGIGGVGSWAAEALARSAVGTLVLIDLDEFGKINDEFGREVGDELLQHVATILNGATRTLDLVARYGGQEFAVLLPETNEMGAMIVAERLRMDLESMLILPLLRPLTASFGVALLQAEEKRDAYYARAGRAVKYAKSHGKNCIAMAGTIAEHDHLYQSFIQENHV